MTVLAIVAKAAAGWSGPEWFSFWVFPILVAAAVGYLTNFIAIEMLFKPYERTGFHWLRLLSLGLWLGSCFSKFFKKFRSVLFVAFAASWLYLFWRVFFDCDDE